MTDMNMEDKSFGQPESTDVSQQASASVNDASKGGLRRLVSLYEQYKPEVCLAVLLVYVVTLAIATIIELIQH